SAYQMLNHGVSTGALFLLFGLLYDRGHTRLMADYGGVAKVMPVFAACFLIITFSSIAVPGTNGFVGEFLVLLGTFKSGILSWGFGLAAATAVILGASYMLWMVQRVFFGEPSHREAHHLADLNLRETATVLPFVVLAVVMGMVPQPFLDKLESASERFVARATLGNPGFRAPEALLKMDVAQLAPAEEAPTAAAQAPRPPEEVGSPIRRPLDPLIRRPLQAVPMRPLPEPRPLSPSE
ncbi:MAG TPA: proton-conducting transporter membrane subunit, partial [Myxococcaceae bacterium]|nr:proton-conducting transporter membrane subunit [Myxococcaceae bacterium]